MTLERLIGLERFRRTRVDWMLEDFKELFPYTFVKTSDEQPDHFLLMIASRIPFDGDQILGQLKMLKESKELKQTAPRIEEFLMWEQPAASRLMRTFEGIVPFFADEVIYDERFLSSYLSVLVEGQISPHNLPPLQKVN